MVVKETGSSEYDLTDRRCLNAASTEVGPWKLGSGNMILSMVSDVASKDSDNMTKSASGHPLPTMAPLYRLLCSIQFDFRPITADRISWKLQR